MGGGTSEQCGSNKAFTGSTFWASLKNLTIDLIWLVTRGGGVGGVWAREAGKGGEMGGGTREQCVSNKAFTGSTFCFQNLTIGLIWLVTRGGGVGGVAREAGKGGEMGGGHQRAAWEQQGVYWFHLLGSLKNLTIGLIWLVTRGGGGGGCGPGRRARGGRWGQQRGGR